MAREQKDHRDTNPPNYRSEKSPRAENPEGCHADEQPGAPSSAAERRVRDSEGCTIKKTESGPRPQTASKDDHEKAIGWRVVNTDVEAVK